jgi:GTP-binding protein HflX
MRELIETQQAPKRALLLGIRTGQTLREEAESLSDELAGLAETLGLEIAGRETVHVRESSPRYGMGTGKARELAEMAADLGADCLIFDQDISPAQQRNWEQLSGISAMDRQELIIRIFADRARTRDAELQAALAELNYMLPRLQHRYIDLSRQRGGRYGTRGAGETRLETDRRQLERRISRLREELGELRKHRELRRKKREKAALPSCALVGYTNAGKSSLLNALTGAGVSAEDKLFATLDPTSRLIPGKGRPLLLIDTVGFIRRLPHDLVDAFRSTLEEAARADLLIHVLDAADPELDLHCRTTLGILRDLGADKVPVLTALNKIDRAPDMVEDLQRRYPGSVPVSARNGQGLAELRERMEQALSPLSARFRFPPDRHDLAALLHRDGWVLSQRYDDTGIEVEARVEPRIAEELREFVVSPAPETALELPVVPTE